MVRPLSPFFRRPTVISAHCETTLYHMTTGRRVSVVISIESHEASKKVKNFGFDSFTILSKGSELVGIGPQKKIE